MYNNYSIIVSKIYVIISNIYTVSHKIRIFSSIICSISIQCIRSIDSTLNI